MPDYGFAPGRDDQDERARELFRRRADTSLVHRGGLATVRDFIGHLGVSPAVVRPIGNVLLGAHANSEGWLFIPMFRDQDGWTNFETLEDTLARPARSISIPNALIGHNAGDPIAHNVHFKGCNIGKARPYLLQFKAALGGNVNVTAPKHFHGLYHHTDYGVWEYMGYEFIIRRPTNFPNRAACVAAFQAGGFTLVDGNPVPNANWNKWIPRRIGQTTKNKINGHLGGVLGRRSTITVERHFRVDRTPFESAIEYADAGRVPPPAARQAAFEAAVRARATMDPAHAYPAYVRLGYASFAEFVAGHRWTHTKAGRVLNTRGDRTRYTVVVPITNPANGNLIFNFHPNAGSPHAPVNGLDEANPLYFETV